MSVDQKARKAKKRFNDYLEQEFHQLSLTDREIISTEVEKLILYYEDKLIELQETVKP